MSTKPASDNLPKYLAIGGALGLAYLAISYLTNPNQKSSSKTVPVETIRNILKEVKYQVYASCIPYSEGVEKKLKAYPKKDVEIYLRTELTKAYEAKEDLILTKYQVSKDEYALALNAYQKDKQIKKDSEEIFKVLEETVKGEIDLSVPEPATRLYNSKELVRVYHEMCVDIGVAVWQKLMECIRNNPAFNAKDDAHFRKAMRELGIYDFKVLYLANKGFKTEWGCPNFIFLKLLEDTKRKVQEVRNECFYIEKGYEEIITKISSHPEDYNKVFINRIMDDTINKLKNPVKVQVQPNPVANQPPRQQAVQQQAPRPVVQPVKPVQSSMPVFSAPPAVPAVEEDEFDMEKLMMEELLSRSQQISKEEAAKKVEAPAVVEVNPEPVSQGIDVKVNVEEKPEPVSHGIDVKLYVEDKPEHEEKKEVHEKSRIVSVGIGFGEEQEEIPVSVVEQAPSIVEPVSKIEEEVVENVAKEVHHTAELVIPQEEQFVREAEVPAQIPEVPVVEQLVVEQVVVVAEEPVRAEPQVQKEPEVIHNIEPAQEVAQPPAEIPVEQQVLPEQSVEQHVESSVEQPEQVQPAVEQEIEKEN